MNNLENGKSKEKTIPFIATIFLIASLVMFRQLISTGYWSCLIKDTYAFTSWSMQFAESIKNGTVYPRWMSLSYWGYGSPTFILYSPLAFYLASFLSVFTGSVIKAMNLAKFGALFFAGTGIFFLLKEFYSEKTALLSASFYMLLPYNTFGLYVYWTFASSMAIIWFAPIILFTYRFIKERNIPNILYAGACYSGLILTHLISAYMFTFIVAGFVLFMSFVKRDLKLCIALPLILIVGGLLSSAYLLPLLYEKQLLNLEAFIDVNHFYYGNNFIFPDLTDKLPPYIFWPFFYKQFLLNALLFCFFTVIFVYFLTRLKKIENNENTITVSSYFLLTAVTTLFLLCGASSFFWKTIPFFKFIQFPHRWLSITAFSVSFLSAAGFESIGWSYRFKKKRYFKSIFISFFFVICILLSFNYIKYAHVFPEHELFPQKTVNWTPTPEHLPAKVDLKRIEKANDMKRKVSFIKGEGKVEIVDWQSENRVIKITSDHSAALRIKTFYFPGWKAYIDGTETKIITESGSGAMLVDVPEGGHVLELKFVDTPIRYYSKRVTLFSLMLVIISIGGVQIRNLSHAANGRRLQGE